MPYMDCLAMAATQQCCLVNVTPPKCIRLCNGRVYAKSTAGWWKVQELPKHDLLSMSQSLATLYNYLSQQKHIKSRSRLQDKWMVRMLKELQPEPWCLIILINGGRISLNVLVQKITQFSHETQEITQTYSWSNYIDTQQKATTNRVQAAAKAVCEETNWIGIFFNCKRPMKS